MSDETKWRTLDWAALVRQYWGPEFYERDVVYRFSNGREFKDTREDGGPYNQD